MRMKARGSQEPFNLLPFFDLSIFDRPHAGGKALDKVPVALAAAVRADEAIVYSIF